MDRHVKFSLFIKCSLKVNTIFFWNFLEVHFILFALFPSNSLYNISLTGESLTHIIFFSAQITPCDGLQPHWRWFHFYAFHIVGEKKDEWGQTAVFLHQGISYFFFPLCEIVHYITIVYLSLVVSNHGWHSFLPECCLQGSCEAAENW